MNQAQQEIFDNATKNLTDEMSEYDKNMLYAKYFNLAKVKDIENGNLSAHYAAKAMRSVTASSFSDAMITFATNNPFIVDPQSDFIQFIRANAIELDNAIVDERDEQYDFMGMNMIRGSYSLQNEDGTPAERPQYVYMRVAIMVTATIIDEVENEVEAGAENEVEAKAKKRVRVFNVADAIECYHLLSQKLYTHATPTLHNSGTTSNNLLSCFIMGTEDDCESIMNTAKNASIISKNAGGIAIHMSNIRSAGSKIKTSNGKSGGLIKQMRIYDAISVCWDQGGGFRKGAFAIYLEPWHGDIMNFLKCTLPHGDESGKCRNLFVGLWMNDLLLERYQRGEMWSLFTPSTAPGLDNVYGEEFRALYEKYEREGKAVSVIHPEKLFKAIFTSFIESGRPYICFKDHANRKSNQSNLGVIKASNLCTEIYEVSNSESYACCTLASISLPAFVIVADAANNTNAKEKISYDFAALHGVVKKIVRYLDNIVDTNNYHVDECYKNSNNWRPIGVGVQGLADVFCMYRIPFISPEARKLDKEIHETIYHAAMESSYELAIERGSYEGFIGSPVNQGILCFDMWRSDLERNGLWEDAKPSDRYDWENDRLKWAQAQRNSLKVALMPTVSTSQLMGNNESFEPFNSNYYVKVTISGNYTIVNGHMIRHLTELGLWNARTINSVIKNTGSLSGAYWVPEDVREIYKTTWEIQQKDLMVRAAIRHAYVDQGQSLNIKTKNTSERILKGIIYGAHKLGLKTGVYYLETKPPSAALSNNIEMYIEETKGCGDACSS